MKTYLLLYMTLMVLCSATAAEPASERVVTLLQVLAQPEKYHKKEIQIIGYLHLEFEGNGLYLHREDYNHAIIGNVIWVETTQKMETDKKALNDKYVIVQGTFDAKSYGHMGLFSGTLKGITRCDLWSDPEKPRSLK